MDGITTSHGVALAHNKGNTKTNIYIMRVDEPRALPSRSAKQETGFKWPELPVDLYKVFPDEQVRRYRSCKTAGRNCSSYSHRAVIGHLYTSAHGIAAAYLYFLPLWHGSDQATGEDTLSRHPQTSILLQCQRSFWCCYGPRNIHSDSRWKPEKRRRNLTGSSYSCKHATNLSA